MRYSKQLFFHIDAYTQVIPIFLYTDFDQNLLNERVAQFRDQAQRYLEGKLTEEEYRPLRLQNGLYVQRYAPMLRLAVPYGL